MGNKYGEKLNVDLRFPEEINHSFDNGKTTVTATLISSLHHKSDSTEYGHYTASCRTPRGWFEFDNLEYEPSQYPPHYELEKVTEDAHMLFYAVSDVRNNGN